MSKGRHGCSLPTPLVCGPFPRELEGWPQLRLFARLFAQTARTSGLVWCSSLLFAACLICDWSHPDVCFSSIYFCEEHLGQTWPWSCLGPFCGSQWWLNE